MILIHVDDLNGINYHRLIAPFTRLMETTDLRFYWFAKLEELKLYDLDIVSHIIISRKLAITNYKAFRDMLDKYEIQLILDNDDFWELSVDNPAYLVYEFYMEKRIKETIQIADEIWTPSKFLAKMTRRIRASANIKIIPNGINPNEDQWKDVKKYDSEQLRFGYIGANGHSKDVGLVGYDFSDKEFYCVDLMDYVKVFGAKRKLDPKPVFEYGTLYKNFDVSIAPLGGGRFNKSKSNLKIVEAAFTKTAIIASNTTPYRESIVHGKTGILCSNQNEWKEAVESMTIEYAKELGNNLYESMKDEYNIDTINNLRLQSLYGNDYPNNTK
jgi:glycosyltransferase involved in cell wall biosynthesis